MSVYTSFVSGPKRANEVDGPDEFYLILLDNGRTKVLKDETKRQSLYCIRCGACLNHCPVYRKIGGHNYPWIYSGPIGAILTPQFHGIEEDPWLPFASSLCGACGEVCPVKIDIPRVLLELRKDVNESKTAAGTNKLERMAFRMWAWAMQRPQAYERLARIAVIGAPRGDEKTGWIKSLPGFLAPGPVAGWLQERDLPRPAARSFRQLWRERRTKAAP
jgi:L-lactate dehydrogenase complex protein LldF